VYNNKFVQLLVDLQKNGTYVYLTDQGYIEFLKMLHDEKILIEKEAM
jgi:hypothetical protein